MGVVTVCLAIFAGLMVISQVQAAECPPVSQVYSCSPKCVQNYDCSHGKLCCENSCHLKSCVEPSKYNSGGSSKGQSGGGGVYCNNVKCSSFEVCKLDKVTNKNKCMRA